MTLPDVKCVEPPTIYVYDYSSVTIKANQMVIEYS
jgi:hypothetical protein